MGMNVSIEGSNPSFSASSLVQSAGSPCAMASRNQIELRSFSGDELGEAEGGVDERVHRDEGCERLEPAGVQHRARKEDAVEHVHWASARCAARSRGT